MSKSERIYVRVDPELKRELREKFPKLNVSKAIEGFLKSLITGVK